jgi:hypothetical protein
MEGPLGPQHGMDIVHLLISMPSVDSGATAVNRAASAHVMTGTVCGERILAAYPCRRQWSGPAEACSLASLAS